MIDTRGAGGGGAGLELVIKYLSVECLESDEHTTISVSGPVNCSVSGLVTAASLSAYWMEDGIFKSEFSDILKSLQFLDELESNYASPSRAGMLVKSHMKCNVASNLKCNLEIRLKNPRKKQSQLAFFNLACYLGLLDSIIFELEQLQPR